MNKYIPIVVVSLLSASVQAGVIVGGTRVIYNGEKKNLD